MGGCKGIGWWNGGMQGDRMVEWGDAIGWDGGVGGARG